MIQTPPDPQRTYVFMFLLLSTRAANLAAAMPRRSRINLSSSIQYAASATAHALCCSVVYISEGRNDSLLDSLALAAASDHKAALIREFRDPTYHRTGYTIGGSPDGVVRASLDVSRRALRTIDLRMHEASHPRIGVVDHISIHPLGISTEARVGSREAGMEIAESLGREGVPALLYGDLKDGRRLAEVRRLVAAREIIVMCTCLCAVRNRELWVHVFSTLLAAYAVAVERVLCFDQKPEGEIGSRSDQRAHVRSCRKFPPLSVFSADEEAHHSASWIWMNNR